MLIESRSRQPLTTAAWFVAGVSLLAWLALPLLAGGNRPAVLSIAVVLAVVAVGTTVWTVRNARLQRQRYEARLAAVAGERAAEAERLRLARDLHDLVSHNLGLVTVRAANALHVADPSEERAALTDIERIGREATTELRRILGVLRQPGASTVSLAPTDSFDALPAMITAARAAGVDVALEIDDDLQASAGAQLVICRVIREGLSNAARHAGPCGVQVSVRLTEDDHLVTTIRDDGGDDWQPVRGSGHGLSGLREQVSALGGDLIAEPQASGGFLLRARFPDRGR